MASQQSQTVSGKKYWLIISLICAVTLLTYWQVFSNGFISYDDPVYVTGNSAISNGITPASVAWAFSSTHAANWHPLTWLSHMLDMSLFHLNPAGHHFTSLLLHLCNSILLALLLRRMTGAAAESLAVAFLFAVHPLQVESVAWVAERKNILSTLFLLLTLISYHVYVKKPSFHRYLLALLTFAGGLMAKPMLVTVPILLLLLDIWPLKRYAISAGALTAPLRHLLLEKVPFLLLSAISSFITLYVQKNGGAFNELGAEPFIVNFANGVIAYAVYLVKMVCPIDLAPLYPFDKVLITFPRTIAAALFLLAVTALVVKGARLRPYLAFGWLWYLVTLIPVIGILPFGAQSMADRYTYVSLIGIFVMIIYSAGELAKKMRYGRNILSVGAFVIAVALISATRHQIPVWHDSKSLYLHALSVTSNNWMMHFCMASELRIEHKHEEAIYHLEESIRIKPDYPPSHCNLGIIYLGMGDYNRAIESLSKAVRINPNYSEANYYLRYAYEKINRKDFASGESKMPRSFNEPIK